MNIGIIETTDVGCKESKIFVWQYIVILMAASKESTMSPFPFLVIKFIIYLKLYKWMQVLAIKQHLPFSSK